MRYLKIIGFIIAFMLLTACGDNTVSGQVSGQIFGMQGGSFTGIRKDGYGFVLFSAPFD